MSCKERKTDVKIFDSYILQFLPFFSLNHIIISFGQVYTKKGPFHKVLLLLLFINYTLFEILNYCQSNLVIIFIITVKKIKS